MCWKDGLLGYSEGHPEALGGAHSGNQVHHCVPMLLPRPPHAPAVPSSSHPLQGWNKGQGTQCAPVRDA